MKISLGPSSSLDLPVLLNSRCLIQASSGGGKSWLLRLIAERAGTHVQTIVIDPEGEFSTLREKLDLVLVGLGGEIKPNIHHAAKLARRLVELRTSAVLDLSELDKSNRRKYVRLFLEGLIETPKKHWHPLLVLVDEAHDFCPQEGTAESRDAINSLMARGRKRGFCGVLCTQRLSKLDKDAAAECGNIFIGRTSPVDQKRAADLLGIPQAERFEFARLAVGEWFGYGPALMTGEVVRFQAHQVATTHRRAGEVESASPPEPSRKILSVAGELNAALDQKGEPATLEEALNTIRELKKPVKQVVVLDDKAVERARSEENKRWSSAIKTFRRELQHGFIALQNNQQKRLREALVSDGSWLDKVDKTISWPRPDSNGHSPVVKVDRPVPIRSSPRNRKSGLRRMLVALAQYPEGLSTKKLGLLIGMSSSSGTFSTYVSTARTSGWVTGSGVLQITPEGQREAGEFEPLPTGQGLLDYWVGELGGGAGRMLQKLAEVYPDSITQQDLAEATGFSLSGTFSTYLSKLRTLQLIEGKKDLKMSGELSC